jgi:NTE family protein
VSGHALALVLGSGGARGFAHIGVLKVCEREGLPVDLIVGTSIGALIGGAYASGMTAGEMEEVALSMRMWRLLSLADPGHSSAALMNGSRVEKLVRKLVGDKTFADVRVPFACVAVDMAAEQQVVLRAGDLASAIRASISTPIIFAPVSREGRLLVDGAVLNPMPVDVARDLGARVVVAVTNLGAPKGRLAVYANAEDAGEICHLESPGFSRRACSRAASAIRSRCTAPPVYKLACRSVELMQRELSESRLEEADLVIAPQRSGTSFYDFHEAKKMIDMGEQAAEAAMSHMLRLASDGRSRTALPAEPTYRAMGDPA